MYDIQAHTEIEIRTRTVQCAFDWATVINLTVSRPSHFGRDLRDRETKKPPVCVIIKVHSLASLKRERERERPE
jgi:hypothetical protein